MWFQVPAMTAGVKRVKNRNALHLRPAPLAYLLAQSGCLCVVLRSATRSTAALQGQVRAGLLVLTALLCSVLG